MCKECEKLSEPDLVLAIVAGVRCCLQHFIRTYLVECKPVFNKLQIPAQDHPDLENGLFIHLTENNYQRLKKFDGRSRLKTWFYTVASRYAIDQLRKRRETTRDDLDDMSEPETYAGALDQAELERQVYHIRLMMKDYLTEMDRDIIRLRIDEDYSARETADFLGTTPNNVNVRLSRALATLRKKLNEDNKDTENSSFP